MRFLDDTWTRLRALPMVVQIAIWLFLFWALVPLLIWRSSLSRGWKTGLTIVFVAALIGSAATPENGSLQLVADEASTSDSTMARIDPADTRDAETNDLQEQQEKAADQQAKKKNKGTLSFTLNNLPVARVTRVIDGDTIEVGMDGEVLDVRLIGIDTPETVHPTVAVECFGPEASAFSTGQLEGERVLLEFDIERTDRYRRTLAYVWLDGKLFNRSLVRQGYAQVSTYPPNVKYVGRFTAAQRAARDLNAGLWGASCPSENEQTAKQPPTGSSDGGKNCDPNYTGACIPPYPPDLDCTEIVFTDFKSVGSDPHGYDGDADGLACES